MRIIPGIFVILLLAGCTKGNKIFTLKTIRLNEYHKTNLPTQKLYLEVFEENKTTPLAHTAFYPSDLTLPAFFKVEPPIPMTLYSKNYHVQLYGDSSGYIASCRINMEEYKIIFPIDMEIENDSLNVSIMGSWK